MKRLSLVVFAFTLAGCETVEDESGRRTTRFDGAAFGDALKASTSAYSEINRAQLPQYYFHNGAWYPVTQP